MKIVLSRKGFDTTAKKSNGSHYGMLPSPMLTLDSGRQLLVSVPIPEVTYLDNKITYGEIRYPHPQLQTMGDVVGAWAMPNSVTANTRAHLDPDLDASGYPRTTGWRGAFGQTGSAQRHLFKQGVGEGSLFLFYGAFRCARFEDARIIPVRGAGMKHVIWGWLHVGKVWPLSSGVRCPDWPQYHPHMTAPQQPNKTLYTASDGWKDLPGYGVFRTFDRRLVLTAAETCSEWKLPIWMKPRGGKTALTYHQNPEAWKVAEQAVFLRTKSPGQEYVLDASDDGYPEAVAWTRNLIQSGIGTSKAFAAMK